MISSITCKQCKNKYVGGFTFINDEILVWWITNHMYMHKMFNHD